MNLILGCSSLSFSMNWVSLVSVQTKNMSSMYLFQSLGAGSAVDRVIDQYLDDRYIRTAVLRLQASLPLVSHGWLANGTNTPCRLLDFRGTKRHCPNPSMIGQMYGGSDAAFLAFVPSLVSHYMPT